MTEGQEKSRNVRQCKWKEKEILVETDGGLLPLKELDPEQRARLEESISGRITGWLEWYLQAHPEKREALAACMEENHP